MKFTMPLDCYSSIMLLQCYIKVTLVLPQSNYIVTDKVAKELLQDNSISTL